MRIYVLARAEGPAIGPPIILVPARGD